MKVPAIHATIGDWTYYIGVLTFKEVSEHVEKIDDELHKSETLKDLIQRSISNNYLKIKEYVLNQPELFFNSLVLAVYDDYPEWNEITIKYEDEEYFSLGFLNFKGSHKIFPVDGQHRVEGIKAALKEDPSKAEQKIGAIFIGHINTDSGKKRTRRLFTTLNRYAKPVSQDDIIALDEDDLVAITTRHLLEEYDLFKDGRIIITKQKAIPETDKVSFTSIITLYQANSLVLKDFLEKKENKKITSSKLTDYLRFRPDEQIVLEFQEVCTNFWDTFVEEVPVIKQYLQVKVDEQPASGFREKESGGNLLFRPVGLLPFIEAVFQVKKRTNHPLKLIFQKFSSYTFSLNSPPWKHVLWNPNQKTMQQSPSAALTKLLFIFAYDPHLLTEKEKTKLATEFSDKVGYEVSSVENVLSKIPIIETLSK